MIYLEIKRRALDDPRAIGNRFWHIGCRAKGLPHTQSVFGKVQWVSYMAYDFI